MSFSKPIRTDQLSADQRREVQTVVEAFGMTTNAIVRCHVSNGNITIIDLPARQMIERTYVEGWEKRTVNGQCWTLTAYSQPPR